MGSVRIVTRAVVMVVLAGSTAAACGPVTTERHRSYAAIVAEEDARGAGGLDRIVEALQAPDPWIRAAAVRSLGRLEDPERIPPIAALLADPEPEVRAAAVTALGQAVFEKAATPVLSHLDGLVAVEDDPTVLGALATTAGRVTPVDTVETRVQADLIARAAGALEDGNGAPMGLEGRLGLARGLEAFARSNRLPPAIAEEIARLAAALGDVPAEEDPGSEAGRIRALATAALHHLSRLDGEALTRASGDPHPEVRRMAMVAVGRSGRMYRTLIPAALDDPDPRVRIAALAAYDRWLRPSQGCGPILALLDDEDTRVATTAADHLASPCVQAAGQRAALDSLVSGEIDGETATPDGWHVPAHALVALAAVAPEIARTHLARFKSHPSPFARAWAARAAVRAADVATLEALAADPDPNVRTAAFAGFGSLGRGGRQPLYRDQLTADDPQLVMTATGLLDGTDPANVDVAVDALARFSGLQQETTRDVRMALVDFIGTAPAAEPAALETYLGDWDPVVAQAARDHIAERTGTAPQASPAPLTRLSPPGPRRLAELERSEVALTMARGGRVVIRLRPDLAATNAHRFARLAEEGYFDGLTFHRVVPNFVIQGGSPGANEYAGDGAYTRDEISSMGHWRGTVGLSTRGRDTGDGQLFVNLVDNPRLDFNYTIFGEVVEGMEVVDRVMEGDVILRATLRRARR